MLTLHVLAALFSFGVIWKADKEALAWIRGKKETLDPRRMRLLHVFTWAGLLVLIATGVKLSYPMLGYLLSQPIFILKLLFVMILLVNAILIGRLVRVTTRRSFSSLSWSERLPLLTSGAVSSISWFGALTLALVLFK